MTNSPIYCWSLTQQTFLAVQRGVVPRARDFNPSDRRESLRIVSTVLSGKARRVRFGLSLLLLAIECCSILRFQRLCQNLNSTEVDQLLRSFFNSDFSLVRRGFMGLSMIAKASVFGLPTVHRMIHFHLRNFKEAPGVARQT